MTANTALIRNRIKQFDFKKLFNELGWDRLAGNITVRADEVDFSLERVSEKKGFQVFHCLVPCSETFPLAVVQNKIQRQIAKTAHENLIIFSDELETRQSWKWAKREDGRLLKSRGADYYVGHSGELLAQRVSQLAVTLQEEDELSLVDVTQRVRAAFDVERVTRRFYERFKQEHGAFLSFIKGIKDASQNEWYASLMMNRLMFVYFVQKKGFLDRNENYLRNRLELSKSVKGKDKFHSFYRYFLLRLFHDGLNKRKSDRDKELETLLGEVPYLNGGLFDVHELEQVNPNIQIADEAFENLFDFFDQYQWHLDDRPLRNDTEINPDVLGYIFEKYINQKQMGAYYTKEDITEYISKNTIIPYIFESAEKRNGEPFHPSREVWRLLRDDPDRYIYNAVGHGIFVDIYSRAKLDKPIPLPMNILAGINDVSKRTDWNQAAPPELALPTETWREHIARRQRCEELRAKLAAGEVTNINELITLNLDICQFAQDVIENCESHDLIRAIYFTIAGRLEEVGKNHKHQQPLSVLDPTCGSGAFLFSSLNILKPLYEGCLAKMEEFVQDSDLVRPITAEDELDALIALGESKTLEFKSTARHDVKIEERLANIPANKVTEVRAQYDKDRTRDILKAVSAMLNTEGGELLIGVKDDGSGFGIHHDYAYLGKKQDRDGFELWLMGLFIEQFGKIVANCINLSFAQRDGVDICRVSIEPASEPAYLKDEKQKKLYIRMGNSSHELDIDEIIKYHEQRFKTAPPARKKPKQAIATSTGNKKSKAKYSDFRGILQEVAKHPNQDYFVLKSIIINNLYGVDIMPEAVEICKLRLFLKLMSVVEPQNSRENMGVEALPDIDFNIRAGNTLVGFATLAQVRESVEKEKRGDMVQSLLGFSESSDTVTNLEEQASIIDNAFKQFRRQQVELGGNITSEQKNDLKKLLRKLTDELDHFLAGAYNIDKAKQKKKFEEWKTSHQPFHWFAEFFGIMSTGGFSTVIGNPPWKEYSAVKGQYTVIGYSTERCGNLHGFCTERALAIRDASGHASFIVQLPIVSSSRMATVRALLRTKSSRFSVIPFDDRPGKLFDGLEHCRSAIWFSSGPPATSCVQATTRYQRWNTTTRPNLFPTIAFAKGIQGTCFPELVPKYDGNVEAELFRRIGERSELKVVDKLQSRSTKHFCFYQEATQYWVKAVYGLPFYAKNGIESAPAHGRYLYLSSEAAAHAITALLNSSLFYVYFVAYSDCFHLSQNLVEEFPIPNSLLDDKELVSLSKRLMKELASNSVRKEIRTKDGDEICYAEFVASQSKAFLDEIDVRIGQIYGLDLEEIEFAINYDYKFRMGGSDD